MEKLPDVIWISLFSRWMTVVETSRFDAAVCNRQLRILFLDSAYNKCPTELRYPTKQLKPKTVDAMMVWIFRRKAPMISLSLTPSLVDNNSQLLTSYLEVCGQGLKWLSLQNIRSFSALAFEVHCPNVRYLSAGECNWDEVSKIVASCQSVEDLHLRGNIASNDLHGLIGKCSALKKLTICAADHNAWNYDVGDVVLIAVVAGCPLLEVLDLTWRGLVKDAVLGTLASACPNLASVSLSRAKLTARALFAWLENSPSLRSVHIQHSTVASIDAITALSVMQLKELYLWYVSMSMRDVEHVLEHSPALQKLTVRNCPSLHVTLADISGLFRQYPQLQCINGTSRGMVKQDSTARVPV
jgi:hypothetical protein